MNEHIPALIPAVGEEAAGNMMIRGDVMTLRPTREQAAIFTHWGRLCVQLHNLLLDFQRAAYSGEYPHQETGWRAIWSSIVANDRAEAEKVYKYGKLRKGKKPGGQRTLDWIVEPGEGREAERQALKEKRKTCKKGSREYREITARIKAIAPQPQPLNPPDLMERINWRWRPSGAPLDERSMHKLFGYLRGRLKENACDHTYKNTLTWLHKRKLTDKTMSVLAWLREAGGMCDCCADSAASLRYAAILKETQPRIFLWASDLNKLMARLKHVPSCSWIGELPSHASQKVVADLVQSISTMLSERGKAARGEASRKTGFPHPKRNRPAERRVFFVYTQCQFRLSRRVGEDGEMRGKHRGAMAWVKFPNGVGWVECRMNRDIAEAFAAGQADFAQGRVWSVGGKWHFSTQWKLPKPAPLAPTGQVAAVKLAAAIPVTVHARGRDGQWRTREYEMPPIDKELLTAHKAAGRRQALALEDHRKRVKKCEARKKWQRARAGKSGLIETKQGVVRLAEPGRARIKLSPGFYAAAARLATLEAEDARARKAWIHELTTQLVRENDVIATQRMEVAKMMKKPKPPEEREDQVKPEWQRKRRSLRAVRIMMRRAAPAEIQATLKYKAIDLRGPQAHEEIPPQHVTAGACSGCGVLHPEFKEQRARGKTIIRCRELLPNGSACNTVLHYTRNSARVMGRDLQQRLEARAERKGDSR